MKDYSELKILAEAATPQDFDSAQVATHEGWIECPTCGGEGSVDLGGDYLNYDNEALGVQFYGIGDAHVKAEDYYRAAKPAAVLALIAEVEGLRAQHGRDSAELRSLCQARDDARKERDQLKAENEQLTEAIGNQTARRFVGDDDQRKIDDLVAAGIREDKRLIGKLKAKIEQQSEEYDKAWRHDLNDKKNVQVLAAEVVSLSKDAARYRTIKKDAISDGSLIERLDCNVRPSEWDSYIDSVSVK